MGLFPCVSPGFGNVVELRINTKGVGGKLPNFGFVVFDDSEPVQRILVAKVSTGVEQPSAPGTGGWPSLCGACSWRSDSSCTKGLVRACSFCQKGSGGYKSSASIPQAELRFTTACGHCTTCSSAPTVEILSSLEALRAASLSSGHWAKEHSYLQL